MLLSFAHFEREIAGERIRDKIAASKAKGMWMGGNVPLGYDVNERKLIVNDAEAETVRMIFRRYVEIGSVRILADDLAGIGVVSKRREGAGGALAGGNRFSRGALYTLLQNPIYRGEIAHQGKVYPGQYEAIVDAGLWQLVKEKLASSRQSRALGDAAQEPSLLAGLMVDGEGNRMTSTHAVKKGRRYRYYVSTALINGTRSLHETGLGVPAGASKSWFSKGFAHFLHRNRTSARRCQSSISMPPRCVRRLRRPSGCLAAGQRYRRSRFAKSSGPLSNACVYVLMKSLLVSTEKRPRGSYWVTHLENCLMINSAHSSSTLKLSCVAQARASD
jgi:hypothetical protein